MQLVKATRDALLRPLQVVSGIVERRQTLPILANILVRKDGENVSFTATDLELQIRTSARSGLARKQRPPLCRAQAGRHPACAAGIRCPARAGQQETLCREWQEPLQPADAGGGGIPDRGAGGVHRRLHVAGGHAQVPAFDGSLCDGAAGHPLLPERHAAGGRWHHGARRSHRRHRLALCEVQKDGASAKIEAIIPRKTILELSRLLPDSEDPVRVQMAATQVKFSFGDVELISKLVEGKVPRLPACRARGQQQGVCHRSRGPDACAATRGDPDDRQVQGVRLCSRPGP